MQRDLLERNLPVVMRGRFHAPALDRPPQTVVKIAEFAPEVSDDDYIEFSLLRFF